MDYGIYCIRDVLVGFGPLILETTDFCAIRSFTQLAHSDSVPIDDYDLYCLGIFNTKTGLIDVLPVPRLVSHGSSLVRKEPVKNEEVDMNEVE